MAVIGSDLHWYLSSSGASEGGAKSATEITDAVDNNVFSDVSDSARIAGGSQVRKIFLANENGVDSYLEHVIWVLASPVSATPYIGLGFDDAGDDDDAAGALVDFSVGAKVGLVSDGADTRTVTIHGLVGTTPTAEDVVLTGAAEVLTAATFAHIYAAHVSAVSASRTITIRQGAGGTTRGQITVGNVTCFRWLASATSKSTGLILPALATGGSNGIWERFDWTADVAAALGNDFALKTEGV